MDKLLHQFLVVVGEKSINAASKILGMSQPALSRNMQRLEENINHTLFTRDASGIALTNHGRVLYHHASIMDREYTYAIEEMQALDDVHHGRIRIGSGYDWSLGGLPQITQNFLSTYPKVSFHIVNGYNHDLVNELKSGRLDIVLGAAGVDTNHSVEYQQLRRVRWKIYLNKQHPVFLQTQQPNIQDLLAYNWIMYNTDPDRTSDMRQYFDEHALKRPFIQYTSPSIVTILTLLQTNPNLITCLPSEVNHTAAALNIIPLPEAAEVSAYDAGIYYRASALNLGYLKQFIQQTIEFYPNN